MAKKDRPHITGSDDQYEALTLRGLEHVGPVRQGVSRRGAEECKRLLAQRLAEDS